MATTITFPNSYLSTNSQPWGRVVEKQLTDIKLMVTSNEINNSARDNQLANSLARVNVALANAQTAITNAQTAIDGVQNIIDNIYVTGTETINGAVVAAATLNGSTIVTGTIPGTKLQAHTITANEIATNYVYAGYIYANQIVAGTLTGFTINTATSGQRIEMYGSGMYFYSGSGYVGSMVGSTKNGYQIIDISSGGLNVAGPLWTLNSLNAAGATNLTGGLTVSGGNLNHSGGVMYAASLDVAAAGFSVDATSVYSPHVYATGTSALAVNMVVSSSTYGYKLYRNTSASSREYKHDIKPLVFDTESYINISPVTFKYKDGYIREEEKDLDIVGFIAEDFIDAGLDDYLVTYPIAEDEQMALRYDKMYMFLHGVVQSQHNIIKDLTNRLETLENK